MKNIVLTPELRTAIGRHIAENLEVRPNKEGTSEYITIANAARSVDNIEGLSFNLNFATLGTKPAESAEVRAVKATKNATDAVAKLSKEQKKAMADALLADLGD